MYLPAYLSYRNKKSIAACIERLSLENGPTDFVVFVIMSVRLFKMK